MNKRLILVLTVLLFGILCVSATAYKDVSRLILNGTFKYAPEEVRKLSADLTDSERKSLYTWNRVSPVGGLLMNMVLGFGSGSFSQKDTGYGVLFLCGDTICTGMIIWNFLKNGGENIHNELYGDGGVSDDFTLAKVGLIAAAALRVWQSIRAVTYANSYNSKLAYALRYDSTPSVALLPFSKDGQTGLTLSAKFSY